MYFKNAIAFPFRGGISLDELEEKLLTRRFAGCGSHDAESYGWTPAHDGRLVYPVGFIWMVALKVQRKLLPGAVIRQHVEKLAAKIEEDSPVSNDGCGLKRSARRRASGGRLPIHPSAMTGVG